MSTDDELNMPEFGHLVKFLNAGKEPTWGWTINGKCVEFNRAQMQSHALCVKRIGGYELTRGLDLNVAWPRKVTKDQWTRFVKRATEGISEMRC